MAKSCCTPAYVSGLRTEILEVTAFPKISLQEAELHLLWEYKQGTDRHHDRAIYSICLKNFNTCRKHFFFLISGKLHVIITSSSLFFRCLRKIAKKKTVRPSVWNNSDLIVSIFIKFDI